jgi:tetratricopeptide (TPR) repeat protein
MTRRAIRPSFWAAVFTVGLSLSQAVWGSGLTPGWQALLDGKPLSETEAALRKDLERDHSDASASYALALLEEAKGEREKSLVTAVEGLRNAPSSPLTFLLQDFISDDATFDQATTRLVRDSIPQLAEEKGLDPMVRFNLHWLAFQLAARTGDPQLAAKAMAGAGFISAAYYSRPETTLSRIEFYKASPAERGKLDAETWTRTTFRTVDVRPPLYATVRNRESNYYILVPFSVDKPQQALLYFNAAKSFRVVLDDKVLLTKDVFSIQENPTVVRRVALAAGVHRLLIKVHATGGDQGIHLALLDADGNPLAAVVPQGAQPPSGPTAGFKDEGDWQGAFPAAFPKEDPRREAFLSLWQRWQGDVASGRLTMEAAADEAPKCFLWNLLAARFYLFEADDLPQKIAQSRAERFVDRCLELAPDSPMATYFKAVLQGANSDSDDDLIALRKLVREAPTDPRWFVALAQRLEARGWIVDARKVLEEASSYHPECESVETAWISYFQQLPDPRGQMEAIRRLEKLRNADPELEEFYSGTRQWPQLHALLLEEAERFGDRDRQFDYRLAGVDVRLGRYAAAKTRLEGLLALDRSDVEVALQLARCDFLMGDRAAGFKVWDELKKAKPDAFQVDLARMALGQPWPFQDKHLSLEQVLKEDKSSAPDKAPSSMLLDQMFTRVEPDGSSLERYHGILRINDKEGVDREGEQSLPGQVILSIRTIKPDGRILEPEQIPDKSTISLQGLEPGDLVEYEYITLKPPTFVKKNAYVTSQVWLFQDIDKPFHHTQWFIEYPKSIPMQFAEKHLPSPGTSGTVGDLLYRDWDYRDMPRAPREPDTPNRMLFLPMVEAVGGIGWKDVGLFLKDGITGAFQITPELEQRYREAVGDASTPEQKLDRMVKYLLQAIDGENQTSWQDPTQTLLTRQGSRLPVMCAFLRLAGIPFRVLIAEAVPDRVGDNLPRLGQFGYPVVEVDLKGFSPRYMVLASPFRAPDVLPWYLQGARALDVTSDEPWKRVTIPADFSPWKSAKETEVRTLQPNGDMELDYRSSLDPEVSENLRSSLNKIAKDQWQRVMQVALSKRYGDIDLKEYHLEGLNDILKPLHWDYKLLIRGYADEVGGRLTVADPLPALHLAQAYASLKDRTLPLTTGGPVFINQEITIVLPPGFSTDYRVQDLDLKTPFGSYFLKGRMEGSRLVIERRVEIPYEIVWPDRYQAFARFLRTIDEAESGQLVLKGP